MGITIIVKYSNKDIDEKINLNNDNYHYILSQICMLTRFCNELDYFHLNAELDDNSWNKLLNFFPKIEKTPNGVKSKTLVK